MGESDISHEIDAAEHKILAILKGKVTQQEASQIKAILEEIKGKLRRGTI